MGLKKNTVRLEKRRNRHKLKNVISLRINDAEKEELEKILDSSEKSISDLMREALSFWLVLKTRSPELDAR